VIKILFRNIAIQFLRALPGAAQDIHDQDNLNYLREIIYYNQAKLTNYNFLGSQKHKLLKESYYSLLKVENPNSIDFLNKLRALQDNHLELSAYLHNEFREICDKNFDYLKKFYSRKTFKSKFPRICVKVVRERKIITFHRDKSNSIFDEPEFPVHSNTAFAEIDENGKHFICNNIPLSIKKGRYRNPRIYDSEVLNKYKMPSLIANLKLRCLNSDDESWTDRWQRRVSSNGERELSDCKQCYKSTLVIPITLENKNGILSNELSKHFKIEPGNSNVIFGFLCFDHCNINFFNDSEDVDIGYIFAQILSLYLMQLLNITEYSSIFKDSLELLRNKSLSYTPSLSNILGL
jgi:hypothetical protein